MFEIKGKYTTATVMLEYDQIEQSCYTQIMQMTNSVDFENPIKIMPDTHGGKGAVIGFTMALGSKLNPSIVGVDIGCGMTSIMLHPSEKDRTLDLKAINSYIREQIPMGFKANSDMKAFKKFMNWDSISKKITRLRGDKVVYNEDSFDAMLDKFQCKEQHIKNSIGSLGGGNHFIEIGKDQDENIWITIHTGSRNLGQQVCKYHEKIAKTVVKEAIEKKYAEAHNKVKSDFSKSEWEKELKILKIKFGRNDSRNQQNLYLEGESLTDYLEDMIVAQVYADANRIAIIDKIASYFDLIKFYKIINSIHNYVNFEDNIIRKGAISAYKGEELIIPWNMRDGLIIGEGKSNPVFNYSAAHGAGRVLSRSAAKKTLNMDEFKEQMKGIYSTSVVESVLDEAPNAYKDFEMVKKELEPTIKITHTVKPILNIKAL